jgi:hypothetical protein
VEVAADAPGLAAVEDLALDVRRHEQRELIEAVQVRRQLVEDGRRLLDAVLLAEIEDEKLAVGEEIPARVGVLLRRQESRGDAFEDLLRRLLAVELQIAQPLLVERSSRTSPEPPRPASPYRSSASSGLPWRKGRRRRPSGWG